MYKDELSQIEEAPNLCKGIRMTAANGAENMMAQLVIYECVAHTFKHTHTRRHLQLQYINIEVLAVRSNQSGDTKATLNSKQ